MKIKRFCKVAYVLVLAFACVLYFGVRLETVDAEKELAVIKNLLLCVNMLAGWRRDGTPSKAILNSALAKRSVLPRPPTIFRSNRDHGLW